MAPLLPMALREGTGSWRGFAFGAFVGSHRAELTDDFCGIAPGGHILVLSRSSLKPLISLTGPAVTLFCSNSLVKSGVPGRAHRNAKTRTGRAMFLTACSPRSSNE